VPRPVPGQPRWSSDPGAATGPAPGEWGTAPWATRLRRSTGSQPRTPGREASGPRRADYALEPGARASRTRVSTVSTARSPPVAAPPSRHSRRGRQPRQNGRRTRWTPRSAMTRWRRSRSAGTGAGATCRQTCGSASASTSSPAAWPWSPSRRSLRWSSTSLAASREGSVRLAGHDLLPGEIQEVPDACKAVSPATLSQYLPGGQPAVAFPPLNGGTGQPVHVDAG